MATHKLTNIKVAIKILSKEKIQQLDMWSKVRREIQILQKFKHPHIVRVYIVTICIVMGRYEVIDTPTELFLVIEYVPGGELFDYIVRKGRVWYLKLKFMVIAS